MLSLLPLPDDISLSQQEIPFGEQRRGPLQTLTSPGRQNEFYQFMRSSASDIARFLHISEEEYL